MGGWRDIKLSAQRNRAIAARMLFYFTRTN
jgi:hypothetical protein